MIEAYLRELARSLDVPARTRARIVAEARDHLMESAARHGEERAIESFGPAAELAHDFHLQLASASVRRSSALTAIALCCSVVLLALIGLGPLGDHAPWTNAGVYGLVSFFAAQVAVVAGAIGVARWARYSHEPVFPPERLADSRRANAVALACLAAIVVSQAAGIVIHAGSLGNSGWTIALAIATGALAVVTVAGIDGLVRALARSRRVSVTDPARDDALADLLAAGGVGLSMPEWIDLRTHPWRFCLLFAAACGIAAAGGHALLEGGIVPISAPMLLAGLAIAAIEGAAVVLAFAGLGRFLRIRA